jgi:U3 small nucleolar RNA-associated protein 4
MVLSFRPRDQNQLRQQANGNVGLHVTRQTPHPYSHDLPIGEAKLVAVTARNQVTEFDVLKGGLTDWSRRNPVAYFPDMLKTVKDPAMGCFWCASPNGERLWLYGTTWLFMLDLSQDLPDPQVHGRIGKYDVLNPVENMQRKRIRPYDDMNSPAKRNTGAGDTIRPSDASIGVTQHTLTSGGSGANQALIKTEQVNDFDSGSDDEPRLQPSTVSLMRRKGKAGTHSGFIDGDGHVLINGVGRESSLEPCSGTRNSTSGDAPVSWYTFQYRAILGVVAIGQDDARTRGRYGDSKDAGRNVEVVIVERPMWDVGYPPRFDGGQDWET